MQTSPQPTARCLAWFIAVGLLVEPMAVRAQSAATGVGLDLTGSGPGPALLAAQLAPAKRAEAQRVFERLLVAYRDVERKLGVGRNEPAGAIATFVAGNVAAYRNAAVTDPGFAALVEQARRALAARSELARSLHVDRAPVVEQMAILGMMMIAARSGKPGADVSAAAKTLLVRHLSIDPGDVEITDEGMRWTRGTATGLFAPLAKTPAPATAPASAPVAPALPPIVAVGFDDDVSYGVGGYMTFEITPVVLFRSGDALRDMAGLTDPGGLDAHRRAHPGRWTKWRRTGEGYELLEKSKWTKLRPKVMRALPRDFRLAGSYSRTGGGGNLAYGGSVAIITWGSYRFDRTGRFSTESGGGSTSPRVSTKSTKGPAGGRYDIGDYTITLRYDDGRVESLGIATYPTDPNILWIAGAAYTRKN